MGLRANGGWRRLMEVDGVQAPPPPLLKSPHRTFGGHAIFAGGVVGASAILADRVRQTGLAAELPTPLAACPEAGVAHGQAAAGALLVEAVLALPDVAAPAHVALQAFLAPPGHAALVAALLQALGAVLPIAVWAFSGEALAAEPLVTSLAGLETIRAVPCAAVGR